MTSFMWVTFAVASVTSTNICPSLLKLGLPEGCLLITACTSFTFTTEDNRFVAVNGVCLEGPGMLAPAEGVAIVGPDVEAGAFRAGPQPQVISRPMPHLLAVQMSYHWHLGSMLCCQFQLVATRWKGQAPSACVTEGWR